MAHGRCAPLYRAHEPRVERSVIDLRKCDGGLKGEDRVADARASVRALLSVAVQPARQRGKTNVKAYTTH